MNRCVLLLMVAAAGAGLCSCDCLGSGSNGFGPPADNEFQLVFNNVVSRETPIYVNGE